jgi:hypothetical protein
MKKIILIFLSLFLLSACTSSNSKYDEFAKCLTQKNIKVYGAFWCSNCEAQKQLFGSSWEKINYIECSTPDGKNQTDECFKAGIKAYPTWEFSNGKRIEGKLSLEILSKLSGCSLP